MQDENIVAENQRLGRLLAFELRRNESDHAESDTSNTIATSLLSASPIDVPAVLDFKWSQRLSPQGDKPIFGMADAAGCVTIWRLEMEPCESELEGACRCRCVRSETVELVEGKLALSLDWSNTVHYGWVSSSFHMMLL